MHFFKIRVENLFVFLLLSDYHAVISGFQWFSVKGEFEVKSLTTDWNLRDYYDILWSITIVNVACSCYDLLLLLLLGELIRVFGLRVNSTIENSDFTEITARKCCWSRSSWCHNNITITSSIIVRIVDVIFNFSHATICFYVIRFISIIQRNFNKVVIGIIRCIILQFFFEIILVLIPLKKSLINIKQFMLMKNLTR